MKIENGSSRNDALQGDARRATMFALSNERSGHLVINMEK